MNQKQRREARESLRMRLEDGCRVQRMADYLGVNSAHVSYTISGKRQAGRTLVEAMIAKGWIKSSSPYDYFKIRRDDPKVAAEQLIRNLGWSFTMNLMEELAMKILDLDVEETFGDG